MSEPDVSDLLSVAQAIAIIDAAKVSPRVVSLPLLDADGLVLAEPILADRDAPPFDKSMMDGFAVRSADVAAAPVALRVIGEVAAGQQFDRALGPGEAIAIMTGAPVPLGADSVIPIEDVEHTGDTIRIAKALAPGKAIARRASDVHAGATVLEKGTQLGSAQIAVAAGVGAARVRVHPPPQVAVLVTGDELVPVDQSPGPAQIRNSNGPMLASLLRRMGCHVRDLGMARDDPDEIRRAITEGLQADAVFISGGMSMGQYDYVPKILQALGADLQITKLRIKPGKPFIFGVMERSKEMERHEGEAFRHEGKSPSVPACLRASVPSSLVFGLPGNPVSAFVCTVRLASRLIARMRGQSPEPVWIDAILSQPLPPIGPREFYQPVLLKDGMIHPLTWKGSADIYTLARANALLVRSENEPAQPAGMRARVLEI
jgi:molybdopterin molybdotransferase